MRGICCGRFASRVCACGRPLGVEVPLLTDWKGDVLRAFGVDREVDGMTGVPIRSAFLIEDGQTVVASWMLGRELPDIDAVIESAP